MRSFASAVSLGAVFTAIACGDSSGPKAGPPANLGVVNQASLSQTAVIGTALPLPLSVVVSDASNRPVSGVLVTFAVSAGGGTLSSSTQTSDANGVASVTWTLGNTFGVKTVTATVTGLPVVTFNTVAMAPDAGVLAFNLVDPANDTIPPPAESTWVKGIDVLSVQGIFKRDSLIVTVTFAGPVTFGLGRDALAGFLEFDIDDNAATGQPPYSNFFGASASASIEYMLLIYGETGTSIDGVLSLRPPAFRTPVAASYSANSIVARIPMNLLGNDDGNFTIVGVIGNDRPTDFFPNNGSTLVRRSHGTNLMMRSSRSTFPEPPPFTWTALSRRHLPAR